MTPSPTRLVLLGALALSSCDKGSTTATPAEATQTEVVPNLEAKPGDTTTCPYSGRPFVVKAEHPKVEYEGESYWVCSEQAAEKVRADPGKYLDDFEG